MTYIAPSGPKSASKGWFHSMSSKMPLTDWRSPAFTGSKRGSVKVWSSLWNENVLNQRRVSS